MRLLNKMCSTNLISLVTVEKARLTNVTHFASIVFMIMLLISQLTPFFGHILKPLMTIATSAVK